MAAVETVTVIETLWLEESITEMAHVPAANGVTAYVAAPLEDETGVTDAICPLYGLHVSLSVNEPVYPVSVTVSCCAVSEEKANAVDDACGAFGDDDGVGDVPTPGVDVVVTLGVGEDPPPPHAARTSVNMHAQRFT
ncbi:MAG: hypothetical protein WBD74_15275 [Candidatus Aquilonibacter sp.]